MTFEYMSDVFAPGIDAEPAPSFSRGDHVELAEALLEQLRAIGARIVFDDGALYREDTRTHVYRQVSDEEQSRRVQGFAGCCVGEKRRPLRLKASDVTGSVKLAHARVAEPGFFAAAPPGVAFRDVFVTPDREGLLSEPLSRGHRARQVYPFPYDADHKPERWLAFLAQSFEGDPDADEKIASIQDYVGACIMGQAWKYQRAHVWHGKGGDGKTTALRVIEAAMPPGSTCSIAPQTWSDEYRLALLAGKRLNVVSELPEAEFLDSEAFKLIVDGSPTTARHIRQAPFTLRAIAGHIFAANRLPGSTDTTHAFWRRFIVVEWPNSVPESKQDPELADRIIRDELPGVVAWALEGAQAVVASGRYVTPASSAVAIERWKHRADQVRAFLEDCTTPLDPEDPTDNGVEPKVLYHADRRWAFDNGHKTMASNTFGQRMEAAGYPSVRVHSGRYHRVRFQVSA